MRKVSQGLGCTRVGDHPDNRGCIPVTRQRALNQITGGLSVGTPLPTRSANPIRRLVVATPLAPPHHVIGHALHDAGAAGRYGDERRGMDTLMSRTAPTFASVTHASRGGGAR